MKRHFVKYIYQDWPSHENEYVSILEEIGNKLRIIITDDIPPNRKGIYLITSDSGAEASINLWKEALIHGPDFANPRMFPWTLASSPAGFFAQHLQIMGPNVSLIGKGENFLHLFDQIRSDFDQQIILQALIIGIDWNFHQPSDIKGECIGLVVDSKELSYLDSKGFTADSNSNFTTILKNLVKH